MRHPFHSLALEEVFSMFESSADGLPAKEIGRRLKRYGPNVLPEKRPDPAWKLLLSQFRSPLMYIMALATIVSFFTGDKVEFFFIIIVMLSNVIVGFWQEHKANKSIRALKNVIRLYTRVIRDNEEKEIDSAEIVPGDVLVLHIGDKVPADGRVIASKDLTVSEAVLTGESRSVLKNEHAVAAPEATLANRPNMVFAGTIVEDGTATVLVVATGTATEYGDIIGILGDTKEEATPLQKMVFSLSKFVGLFITLFVLFIILEGLYKGEDFRLIFETSLALFISAIPEGLLPGITIVLVLGMRRILKRRGLVRRLAATETLGGVTVICTDKTGTLTEGKMEASELLTSDGLKSLGTPDLSITKFSKAEDLLVRVASLTNNVYIENPGAEIKRLKIRGTLTEQALVRMAVRLGFNPLKYKKSNEVADSILFSSERKFSAALLREGGSKTLYVLGAPEKILPKVSGLLSKDYIVRKESGEYKKLLEDKDKLIGKGLRVLAGAYKFVQADEAAGLEEISEDLVLAGFVALSDPVRFDVPEAFRTTEKAGIHTVIVTGDNAVTARNVASQIGLEIEDSEIMEGDEIEKLSNNELFEKVGAVKLYARVSPRHKLRIVKAFHKKGEIVAVFGDGVNDAPALKAADIGVAVNPDIAAARETADIVLLDGGFATIIAAIEQGRIVFQNIRKVFLYLITQDFSSFFIFTFSIFFGMPLPVLAVQMLTVNLVESGLPDLALTTEQEKEGVMEEPPRPPKESVLDSQAFRWMLSVFLATSAVITAFYLIALGYSDVEKTRTMMMVFLSLESLFIVFTVRSFRKSVWRKDIFSNRILTGAVIISLVMVLAAVYFPPLQRVIGTTALKVDAWILILAGNLLEVFLVDRLKLFFFRKKGGQPPKDAIKSTQQELATAPH